MCKLIITPLILLLFSFSAIAQLEEIKMGEIAAKWKDGDYDNYSISKNLVLKNGTEKIVFQKGNSGVVEKIKIGNTEFKLMRYKGTIHRCYESRYGRLLHVMEYTIIEYKLEDGKPAYATNNYGVKFGNSKKSLKPISDYWEAVPQIYENREADKAAAVAEHKAKYSTEGKDISKIEIDLVSQDDKIDCGSKFLLGYKVILSDGSIIKSKSLGGQAFENEFILSVKGAKGVSVNDENGKKTGYKEYTVSEYCDYMKDKQVVVVVKSKLHSNIVAEKKISTSCVPDPEVIARKKREEEKRKERELLAAQEAQQEKERDRLLAEQQKKAAARSKALASSMSNGKVVGNGNEIGLLVFDNNVKGTSKNPKGVVSNNFKTIKGKLLGFGQSDRVASVNKYNKGLISSRKVQGEGESFRELMDGDLDNSGNLYFVTKTKLGYGQNIGTSFSVKKSISSETIFGKGGVELCAVASIGENKCIVFGYTIESKFYQENLKYDKNNRSTKIDKAYMAIWDRTTGSKLVREISEYHTLVKPKLIKTFDGNVVIGMCQQLDRVVWKIDPLATFKNDEIKTIWKIYPTELGGIRSARTDFGLIASHMFEDKDKNIVISYIDDHKVLCFQKVAGNYNDHENKYCGLTAIARVDKNGALYQENSFLSYNLSKWGGSHEYSLKSMVFPGQIFMDYDNYPVITQHPITGDYIMSNIGVSDQISYPLNFTRTPQKSEWGDEMVAQTTSANPMITIVSGLDLSIQSFDIVNTDVTLANGEKTSPPKVYGNKRIAMIEYDNSKKEIILYHEDSRFMYKVRPSFLLQWAPGSDQDVTQQSFNKLNVELASTSSSSSSNSSSRKNNTSSSSSSSNNTASKKEEVKKINVRVNPNSVGVQGNSSVYIYWEENGSSKKKITDHRTTVSLGEIPVGTELFYSLGKEGKRHSFYTVPGNKGNSVTAIVK